MERDEQIGNSIMLDKHENIIIFCQKTIMYKVLPKAREDLKVEKYV